MKAFIFVALVASVAARSLDLETLRVVNKEKSLLNTPVVANKVLGGDLLKEQLKKDVLIGQENVLDTTVLPVQDKPVGGIYNYDNVVDVDRVLTIQELYTTELFKEYLQIPLFRQYIQYPSFQRFVSSVYFQRFWQLPAYKQYYVNPILFYKYVYPIVTELFNTEYTVPSVYDQNEDVLGLQTLVDDVLLKNKNFLPYAYNYNRFSVPTTAFPGTTTNYKFLLEKLNKNLYTNQKVQDFQVKTDVKLIPEKVVVEPITNKVVVEEPKIVDVQVDQKIVPFVDSIVPVTTDSVAINERDVYLLKQLLNENIITPEVFQAVIYGKYDFVTVLRQLTARGGINADLLNTIIARLQVVDTVVPYTTDSVVLSERQIVILKDLLQKNYITPEIYQAIIVGKYEFTTVIRQVLERRGITSDLISLIINRLVAFDTVVPVSTEQDVYIVKELLRQRLITSEVYQAVLVGKLDFFTLIRQIIVRRDVIDSVIPTVDSVVLTERNFALLKDLLRQNVISQEIYEAVLYGKYDFVTVLRQVLERKQIPFNLITLIVNRLVRTDIVDSQQDTYLLKELLRQRLITSEIYQAVIFNKIDFFTVLRQVIFRDIPFTSDITPFVGNDRYNFNVNKYYGYKNLYNTEIPTFRDNIYNYNRYPIVA